MLKGARNYHVVYNHGTKTITISEYQTIASNYEKNNVLNLQYNTLSYKKGSTEF